MRLVFCDLGILYVKFSYVSFFVFLTMVIIAIIMHETMQQLLENTFECQKLVIAFTFFIFFTYTKMVQLS
jgi:hypothetical protein